MDKDHTPVNVTISGKDALAVKATAAVIGDALNNSGFSDVRLASLNRAEENENSYLGSSASMMDVLKRTRPHLLNAPVIVEYMHHDPSAGSEQPPRDQLSSRDLGPRLDAHAHHTRHPEERDGVIGAEVPLSPAQEQEQEFDIAAEVTGNVGAVDGDPVAADPDDEDQA